MTQDEVLYDATLRNLQTLSEATQLLPEEKKAEHPVIPWRQISGFRNILVHSYLGDIDPLTVNEVVERHLAPWRTAFARCLPRQARQMRKSGSDHGREAVRRAAFSRRAASTRITVH